MTNQISAKIIADSINDYGDRLTSYVLVFPRIVLAEFNTHRMLSKNSASSRAIPFEKMLEKVSTNPFIPIRWMKEHKGMQGSDYFTDEEAETNCLLEDWLTARDNAVSIAKALSNHGLTKQVCNRLLEPFMYHTVIVTGTEWENFFALRAHDAAEIHIQYLAHKMLIAYNKSTPKRLKNGQWHIPFGDNFNVNRINDIWVGMGVDDDTNEEKEKEELMIKIATARCARVSYDNFDGTDDYNKDIALYDRLSTSGHWSPFEHCAYAMHEKSFSIDPSYIGQPLYPDRWCGNYKGFIQLRKTFTNENKSDSRVKRH